MTTESAQYLATLHKQIDTYFDFSEVRTLCFELGVDYENIPGDRRSAFIRNLIVSLARQNRLQELVDKVKVERPFVDWQDVPRNFALPASVAQEDIRQVVQYTVYGDVVQGDKISGDQISVGNISGGEGIAIGSGASASVQKTTAPAAPASANHPSTPALLNEDARQAGEMIAGYLQIAQNAPPDIAAALESSVPIILRVAAEQPGDAVHLKLLCLGQTALARQLAGAAPGIEQVVERFVTAVQSEIDR